MQSVQSGRVTYARAMGPMQFLPGTWARYASDGDGDGKADVQNLYDSTLAAARYLCSGNLNLRDRSQVMTAILRYNNSVAYAQNVLGWAAAYATGVVPVESAAHHRTRAARRRPPRRQPRGPRPRPAAQCSGTTCHRSAGADPAAARHRRPARRRARAAAGARRQPRRWRRSRTVQVFCLVQQPPAAPPAELPPAPDAPFAPFAPPPLFPPPPPPPPLPFAPLAPAAEPGAGCPHPCWRRPARCRAR